SGGVRSRGWDEVDDAETRRALLEERFAPEPMKELRRERHVTCAACAVGRLRDAGALLRAHVFVSTKERRREVLLRDVALRLLFAALGFDLRDARVGAAFSRPQLLADHLRLFVGRIDLDLQGF